ncbi:hypothetical protein CH292_10525 [Rhodococcus sp. 14-2470-1a]|nr:hypothetical protein CH292_10525 [Rhodococcus sp. 14-2470-1a]
MSPARLAELRTALAALVDTPLATLEAHPVPETADLSRGLSLGSASPLAVNLAKLIDATPDSVLVSAGEALFRLVMPAKFATLLDSGLETSKVNARSGVGLLQGATAVKNYLPAIGNVAGGGGIGAVTAAAPLLLMAVAAGLNALAESDRRGTDRLLKELKDDALRIERSNLNACTTSLDSAANILLDQGRIGVALGLDTAAFQINVGLANAEARIQKWESRLRAFTKKRAEAAHLEKAFPGIGEHHGEFHSHVDLARLAFELHKRLAVVQAIEHAQLNPDNAFERFSGALKRNRERVDLLQNRLSDVLLRLSKLEVDRSHGVRDFVFKSSEVDSILQTSRRVRALSDKILKSDHRDDVAVEIARKKDGSLVVMPALSV